MMTCGLLRQQVSLEQLFSKQIGVDERVCWIGKLPPIGRRLFRIATGGSTPFCHSRGSYRNRLFGAQRGALAATVSGQKWFTIWRSFMDQ